MMGHFRENDLLGQNGLPQLVTLRCPTRSTSPSGLCGRSLMSVTPSRGETIVAQAKCRQCKHFHTFAVEPDGSYTCISSVRMHPRQK